MWKSNKPKSTDISEAVDENWILKHYWSSMFAFFLLRMQNNLLQARLRIDPWFLLINGPTNSNFCPLKTMITKREHMVDLHWHRRAAFMWTELCFTWWADELNLIVVTLSPFVLLRSWFFFHPALGEKGKTCQTALLNSTRRWRLTVMLLQPRSGLQLPLVASTYCT